MSRRPRLIAKAIERFLQQSRPEVVCIKGAWGVGKTFAWNKYLVHARQAGTLGTQRYAYVSLFGVKDTADIYRSIFANLQDFSEEDEYVTDFGIYLKNIGRAIAKKGQVLSRNVSVPYIKDLGDLAQSFLPALSANSLVCLDDLERRAKNLSLNEVFGIATQLRDVRKCKLVLLVNYDALTEGDKNEFDRFAEKSIDISFVFQPSAEEAVAIAFDRDDEVGRWTKKNCIDLGITNIRILKRIERACDEVDAIVAATGLLARQAIARSLCILC